MLDNFNRAPTHFVEVTSDVDPSNGVWHHVVSLRRRSPDHLAVYVAHPITGIRVSRILEMQDAVRDVLARVGQSHGLVVDPLFPMRTTHLTAADVADNEYVSSKDLFSDTRHYTLQNRLDALLVSDAVLVNMQLADDEGTFRVSKGMPFDYGWATAAGKPFASVVDSSNPNWCPLLEGGVVQSDLLDLAVERLLGSVEAGAGSTKPFVLAEIFDFSASVLSFRQIERLAQADARRLLGSPRAILSIIPDGRLNPNWHGQVKEVSDWVLDSMDEAELVVAHLANATARGGIETLR